MVHIFKNKKAIIVAAAVLLTMILLFNWLRPNRVTAFTVEQQNYVPSLLLSGEVIAGGSTILSANAGGTVVECPAAKGETVQKSQLLVQIDDRQARLDRDRAAVALQIAEAQLRKAAGVTFENARAKSIQAELDLEKSTSQYNRIKTLADAGAVSQAELEEAYRAWQLSQESARAAKAALNSMSQNGPDIEILQAEVQQRRLDLQEKEKLLEDYKIIAPADGVLMDLYVKPGELLSKGSQAALLAAGQGLRIKIKPDQRYAMLAAQGNQAKVWVANADANKWDARVVYTEPLGNAEQGSFTAELAFTGTDPDLYPGQLVSVQLFAPAQSGAIIIPDQYLTEQSGQNGVWLAVNNRAHFTAVQIGLRTGDGVVINNGLRAGDVILEPTGLTENQKVSARSDKG
jgi:multidrug efflux pump subunit AcrA (membrane-fusion protein)